MKPGEGEYEDLRLAATAADREKAAKEQWPAFEKRLEALGYGPRAIAHAFRTLSGPGTVAQALEVLRAPMPESHPVALSFEVTETRGGLSRVDRVTITSVERDDPRQLRSRPARRGKLGENRRRCQGQPWQRLPLSRQLFRPHRRPREYPQHSRRQHARPRQADDAAPSPASNHASHPNHMERVQRTPDAVGHVSLIDLGETSARSPRPPSGLIENEQDRA